MKIVLLEMLVACPEDSVPSSDKKCFTGLLKIFFELTDSELEKFYAVVGSRSGRNITVGELCFTYTHFNPSYKVSVLLTAVHAQKLFETTNRSVVSSRVKAKFEKILVRK